jgi:hypothetical protein
MIKGFEDKVALLEDGWAVRFNGCIEAARWVSKGAAEARLMLLQMGVSKPQPQQMKSSNFNESLLL